MEFEPCCARRYERSAICLAKGAGYKTDRMASHKMNPVFTALSLILWALTGFSFAKDRSRYRNCYLLFVTLMVSIVALTFIAGDYQAQVMVVLMFALFLTLLIVPIFLVINGVVMIRREGHSLANLLSLGLGLVVGIGEIAAYLALVMPQISVPGLDGRSHFVEFTRFGMFLSASVFYFSMTFVVFMTYCVFLQVLPLRKDFDYVIIHGAGLLGGDRVSKLLADRIDKAIAVYRRDPTPPILIPSGGKGSDESISEAEAMERYLLEKGVPAEQIAREDQSATTLENLRNSKAIIDELSGGRGGYTALVTSNYHVYRALRYCRRIGLRCVGIGSHVAFYYWPSALIREYIAVHAERKRLITLLVGWLLFMAPMILANLIS